jgi:alkyl sulfatase BDS1-like metallo-beta-lactamase superfamily hydrolase
MKTVDQDILFDQMFVRMAKAAVSKKTIAVANKLENGDVHFVMTVHCLNREPNRILRAIP